MKDYREKERKEGRKEGRKKGTQADRAVPVSWNRVSVSSYNYPVVNYDRCLASPCVSFFFIGHMERLHEPRAA